MERVLHPELIKRTLATVDNTDFIHGLGATYMLFITKINDNEHILNRIKI